MSKECITVLDWDEIGCHANTIVADNDGIELTLPITCTDEELKSYIRKLMGEDEGEDESWTCDDLTRGKNTATIEWRSDRRHLAVTTIIWTE